MSRRIVICCDGTSDQFGPTKTNVLRLVRLLKTDESTQIIHYEPGVGTLPEPGYVTPLMQKWSIVAGLAFGAGLQQDVQDLYSYLMDVWEPGDEVYLFGFSRGAYTVRVLAGMLHSLGLLERGNQNLVPYAMRLFRSVRTGSSETPSLRSDYWELCDQFRSTFARPVPLPDDGDNRRFPIRFLGAFDTVSSVGWVWEPATFPFTAQNPSVKCVRHAVSIDERRWFFRQNLFTLEKDRDIQERWLAGSHGDVGGGYAENFGQVWRNSLNWMIEQASHSGLEFDSVRLNDYQITAPAKPWLEPIHDSLTWVWWPLEFFPKWRWSDKTKSKSLSIGLGRHREIKSGALIDRSALLRIRQSQYIPPNLPSSFLETIRGLDDVPDVLAVP